MRIGKVLCIVGAIGIICVGATNILERPALSVVVIGAFAVMTFGGCKLAGGWDAILKS